VRRVRADRTGAAQFFRRIPLAVYIIAVSLGSPPTKGVTTLFSATIISLALVFTQPAAPKAETYSEARQAALEGRLPLVVFVGEAKRKIHGTVEVSVKAGAFEDYPAKCIIVGYSTGEWRVTLAAGATDAEIDRAAKGDQPSRAAYYAGPDGSGSTAASGVDAIDEVNAARAQRGLRPYARDEGLTQAARDCAAFRAARLIQGHTASDFNFLPAGVNATSAGCAAWTPDWGWGSCCTYENHTYAGAAWVMGSDGRRYMQLFVR
jgi:uncharacterized protein YkwD